MGRRPILIALLAAHVGPGLSGCTLIDLSQLQGGTGAAQSGGENSGAANSGAFAAAGGNGTGAEAGSDVGAGGAGGGVTIPTYDACILDDLPTIYFRLDAARDMAAEPNLGTSGGTGLYVDNHAPQPGLIDSSNSATTFGGSSPGTLLFSANGLFGGFAPFSVELWLAVPQSLATTELVRYGTAGDRLHVRLQARAVVDGLDAVHFRFLTAGAQERSVIHYLDLADPPAQVLHVVAVYRQSMTTVFAGDGSSNDMALYVNGMLASEMTVGDEVSLPTFDAALDIGNGYDGVLDEPAIYDRELTADEVARHYAAGLDQASNCGATR